MRDRLLSTLGLCRRAGKLVWGFDAVAQAVAADKAELVLFVQDLSPKSAKEMRFLCEKKNITPHTAPVTMDEIWFRVGKRAGILAVCDQGLSHKITELISRMHIEEE